METLNKKIYFLIGFLLVISIPLSNIANATCPPYPDEVIFPTISITGVSVTDGIVTIGVSFTAGTRIYRDKDGNITTICYGEITQLSLYIYTSDGNKFGERHFSTDHVYSGLDTLQWVSPSFAQDNYTLEVYACDTGITHDLRMSRSAPATATVFVDNPLPRITSPADGSTVQGVGMYGVVDVTCEFFSPIGIRELRLGVWDGHYPLPKRVFVTGHAYSEPYPTSGTCTFQWQSGGSPQGACNLIVSANDCSGGLGRWGRSDLVTVILVKGPPTGTASFLAIQAIGADYLWGGKGYWYGYGYNRFVITVHDMYKYWNQTIGDFSLGSGLDCSGLVLWSYNKAYGATEYQEPTPPYNPVHYVGADAQYWFNSRPIEQSEVTAGDLLFFDWEHDGERDHVEMYVGDFYYPGGWIRGTFYPADYYNVVRAWGNETTNNGIVPAKLMDRIQKNGFVGFRRVIDPIVGETVYVQSPVNVIVTDPDGFTISKDIWEIPAVLYYSVFDIDGDGEPDDMVTIPTKKTGFYFITVDPEPDALPTDTYTLEFNSDGQTLVLADGVAIKDIPDQGYVVRSDENGFINIVWPVNIDIYPNRTPNRVYLSRNYTLYVAVLGSRDFNVAEHDSSTVKFGRTGTEASPVRAPTMRDLNADGFIDAMYGFMTFDCGFQLGDTEGVLTGKKTGGMNVIGRDSVLVSN